MAALLSKFVPEKFDYVTLLGIEDIEARLRAIFSAVEESLQIIPPCSVAADWQRLSKSAKQNYIGRVVGAVRADPERLLKSLIIPKSTMKRRIQPVGGVGYKDIVSLDTINQKKDAADRGAGPESARLLDLPERISRGNEGQQGEILCQAATVSIKVLNKSTRFSLHV